MSADTPLSEGVPEEEARGNRARTRRRSRYDRPRTYISWFALCVGITLGIAAGYTYVWRYAPAEQDNVAPSQLQQEDRDQYVVAIILNHAYEQDLSRAIDRLLALDLPGNDPIQAVADVACRLAQSDYVGSSSGLRSVRALMAFYRSQGRSGCADDIFPMNAQMTPVVEVVLPTPTLRPPATKTATPQGMAPPTPTSPPPVAPTNPPSWAYNLVAVNTFCDVDRSGLIEVFVRGFNSDGTPGQPIRVRWDVGESLFFTGLQPERGPGYADFQMEAGKAYIIEMPGLSDPSTSPLVANICYTDAGSEAITSYRVVFQVE